MGGGLSLAGGVEDVAGHAADGLLVSEVLLWCHPHGRCLVRKLLLLLLWGWGAREGEGESIIREQNQSSGNG